MSPGRRKRGIVATLMGGRRRAGFGLLLGAVVVWLGGEAWGLHWVPLLAGAGALVAAFAAGEKHGPWGPACVLLGWGGALLGGREGWVEQPEAQLVLAGVGAGLVAAALLAERGHAVSLGGTAVAALVSGLAFLFHDDVDVLARPSTYALAVAVWAVVDLLELDVGRR